MLKTKAKSLGISFVAIAALLATGCNKTTEQERKRHSGIIRENMDTTIAPGHNFTAFVNGAWVKKTQIPADKAAYGVMSIVRDKAQENVKSIIEASAAGDFKQGSEEQKIGDLYESYMNLKARDSIGLKPLEPELQKIAAIANYKDLARYFAYANKYSNSTPFSISVTEDFKNPKQYMVLT
ncbi:MAG: peptidase [Adhaeribacter sp.]|nr:peptidase [Adhaeribacter sp.]